MKYLLIIFPLLFLSCNEDNNSEKEIPKTAPVVNKPDTTTKAKNASIQITPLDTEADQGQVTFSQNNKTVFYYNLKSKKGKIILDSKEYMLDQYSNDNGTYKLSGEQVSIIAPKCVYDKNEGTDCFYGKFPVVTISLGTNSLILNDVKVQDCPIY